VKLEAHLELTAKDLEDLFKLKGWMYATPSLGYGIPNSRQIKQCLFEATESALDLVAEFEEADGYAGTVFCEQGRFMAVKEPGMSSVQLYLHIGQIDVDEPSEDDYLEEFYG
jgi:hypothetical protein